jgi:flagellar basal body-associated protein FliL
MSDATQKTDASSGAVAQKKLPLKPLLILLAVVMVEGAAISTAFLLSGKPAAVRADAGAEKDEALKLEEPIEELVVADKFQNTRSGRTYLYDMEIYMVVRKRNQELVKKQLEMRKAQVRQDIRTIISRAEPNQMLEPTLASLTRQIQAVLDDRIGRDAQDGKPLVESVLITKCTQFRVDL